MNRIFNFTNILLGIVIFLGASLFFNFAKLQEQISKDGLNNYQQKVEQIYNVKNEQEFISNDTIPTSEKLEVLNISLEYNVNTFDKILAYFNNIIIIIISACGGALIQRISTHRTKKII